MVKVLFIIFSLFSSSYSVVLDCVYSPHWWPAGVGEKFTCITTLSEVSTTKVVTSIRGEPENKTLADVESISFNSCHGTIFIPQDMQNFFPNLIGIQMFHCGVLTLDGNELNQYENLQLFAIESTQLERIPGNFFAMTPQIKVIGFAENDLKYVGSKLLNSLNNLTWVSFYNSGCINQTATSSTEIESLISHLTTNCIDIFEITTTRTTSTTVMTSDSSSRTTTADENNDETTTNGCNELMMNLLILLSSIILIK